MSANASIEIQPLISYPRMAAVGKSYVMTVDLRQASLEAQWPYEAEEYTIHLMLDSQPLFASESIGDASVVLHRFGGTYGPATFLLTASQEEMQGNMRLTLVNDSGMPVDVIEIPGIRVTAEGEREATREVVVTKETAVASGRAPVGEPTPITDPDAAVKAPPGFRLRHTLRVSSGYPVGRLSWSPDGKILVVPSNKVQLCDAEAGRLLSFLSRLSWDDRLIGQVAFSPDGQLLALDPGDYSIEVWDPKTSSRVVRLTADRGQVSSFAWSPDSKLLAACSMDGVLDLWDVQRGHLSFILNDKISLITCVAWFPDGQRYAVGTGNEIHIRDRQNGEVVAGLGGTGVVVNKIALSTDGKLLASIVDDQTILLWETTLGSLLWILEQSTANVVNLSFSSDSRLLVSESSDGVVKVWHCETGKCVAQLDRDSVGAWVSGPAFSPTQPTLATVEQHNVVRIWDLDLEVLLGVPAEDSRTPASYVYSSAKVVLLGDSGAGKSALANRLVSNSFVPTPSTHGCQIWVWKTETTTKDQITETREIILWDLGGQPNYRLLHSLQVADASVALILFDPRHHEDPFGSVRFWDAVLRQAQTSSGVVMRKILVATRVDISGVPAQRSIDSVMQELGFHTYSAISAKDHMGIRELSNSIESLIDWNQLAKTISNAFTKKIRDFVMQERDAGKILVSADDLFQASLASIPKPELDSMLASFAGTGTGQLKPHFDLSIGTLENHNLARRLGDYILLRPELIDTYASSIINAARNDPNGLGTIREDEVLLTRFAMPSDERVNSKSHERAIIEGAIDAFLRHEIALRIGSEEETLLAFPSLITAENTELYEGYIQTVRFQFEGVVETVWARLCIRLSKNNSFGSISMARNACTCVASDDTRCAMALSETKPSRGELMLLYRNPAGRPTDWDFEEFVADQLSDLAIRGSVRRYDIVICPNCQSSYSDDTVQKWVDRGLDSIFCTNCENQIPLPIRKRSRPLKIYVSSPFAGLQEYRSIVFRTLKRLGHETAFAEESNAVKSRSFEWMRETIAECDVYICILAWYRGYVPDLKDGKSIVEIEYETARELKKPVLVFLRDPMTDAGQYESSRELEDFRQQLLKEEHCAYFTTPTDLAEQVGVALTQFSTPEGEPPELE